MHYAQTLPIRRYLNKSGVVRKVECHLKLESIISKYNRDSCVMEVREVTFLPFFLQILPEFLTDTYKSKIDQDISLCPNILSFLIFNIDIIMTKYQDYGLPFKSNIFQNRIIVQCIQTSQLLHISMQYNTCR